MSRHLISYALLLATLFLWLPIASTHADEALRWENAADDLWIARATLPEGGVFAPELILLRTTLRRFRVGVIRAADFGMYRASVKTLCEAARCAAAVNANFFDENGKALGLVLSRGIMHQDLHRGGRTLTGVFQASASSIAIKHRNDFHPPFVLEAIQAGPRLLADGAVVQAANSSTYSRRAGICIDRADRLILYISSGIIGITISQVQQVMRQPGIDCREVLNLDGGGSAQMFIRGDLPGAAQKLREVAIEGRDNIPIALGLFRKE